MFPRIVQCATWTTIPAVQAWDPVRPVRPLSQKFRPWVECYIASGFTAGSSQWKSLKSLSYYLDSKIHLTPASPDLIVQIGIWIFEPSGCLSSTFLFLTLARVGFCYAQPQNSDRSAVVERVGIKWFHLYKNCEYIYHICYIVHYTYTMCVWI